MIFKDTQVYESYHANSNDEYGKTILDFAERWAELLEKRIINNFEDSVENTIEKHAEETCDEIDKDFGISGYAYGCAISFLADTWEYGDHLKDWHNKKYDYAGNGVINPARLVIEA